jgi:putative endonuclease
MSWPPSEPAIHGGARTLRQGYVYILASKKDGTLYIGVTNDLSRRTYEHKIGKASAFTRRYGVNRLVWYEAYPTVPLAIQRETCLKRWKRAWKIALIEEHNPDWKDLSAGLT